MHIAIPALVALAAVYITIQYVRKHYRYVLLSNEMGCKPAPSAPTIDPFGVHEFVMLNDARSRQEMMEHIDGRFDAVSAKEERQVLTYKFKIFGTSMYMSRDPKVLQAMLATQFKDFELGKNRNASFEPLFAKSILSTDGEAWAHHRAILRPHFNRDQIGDLDLIERHVQMMMKALPTSTNNWTQRTNLQLLFERYTMDTSAEYFMGHNTNSQMDSMAELATEQFGTSSEDRKRNADFVHAVEQSLVCVADALFMGDFYWLGLTRKMRELCNTCHEYVDRIIQDAVARKKDYETQVEKRKRVLIEALLEDSTDPIEVRNESLAILLAGRDTTAALLSWLFVSLHRSPHVLSRLRERIIEDFGTFQNPRDLSFTGLKSCYYLQWCLHETLRLYPVFPVNTREAATDTSLPTGGGPNGKDPIFVPKGTNVMFSVWAMHRDEAVWGSDADQFRPERWDGRKSSWEYLPFSGGPRICLGQQLALTQAGYVTVRLLQRFDQLDGDFEPGRPKSWMSTNILPRNGVKARLHGATQDLE